MCLLFPPPMVIFLCFLICLRFSLCCSDQQYYDWASCFSNTDNPGTRYTCTSSSTTPCRTFFVYRANNHLSTISNISKLFSIDSETLISINKHVSNPTQVLETGHEVLLPILCSCSDGYYRSSFSYTVTENATLSPIACGIFQGLVKPITLAEENVLAGNADVGAGFVLRVPLKCACPDDDGGAKYLITYPLIKGDNTMEVSQKFNVSLGEILRVNHLDSTPIATVYPNTTVLVPLRDEPSINFTISSADPPAQFLPTKPVVRKGRLKSHDVYIAAGSVVVFSLILAFLISCGLYLKGSKAEAERKSCSTPLSSHAFSTTPPCLSPDFLVGIKYSLCNYTLEELKRATRNFGEDSRMSSSVYKGVIERGEVMIKEMRCGGTKEVIDVHSRINHVNILKLHGVCYSEEEDCSSYVVMEYPRNGSLRECLSGGSMGWVRRTQIALDIATGLHYLHYSVIPSYTHLSLSSKNVFLNSKWRAKISVLGESGSEWLAPEHVVGNEKVDIFAFGVVLTELISGKEAGDGRGVRESLRFLGTDNGGGGGGCFDEVRRFVDPGLKDDYPLAEALCLCVLAGSCLQHHPLHRPSIDHLLQILSTML